MKSESVLSSDSYTRDAAPRQRSKRLTLALPGAGYLLKKAEYKIWKRLGQDRVEKEELREPESCRAARNCPRAFWQARQQLLPVRGGLIANDSPT